MFSKIIVITFNVTLLLSICVNCSDKIITENGVIIYSTGAEYSKNNYLTDSVGFSKFENAGCKINDISHNGDFAIKLDSNNLYGFGITIDDPKEGELYQASVWQKKGLNNLHGTLMCSIKGKNNRIVRTWYDNKDENDWYKHTLSINIDRGVKSLNFYVYSGGNLAFFDDIKIKRFASIPKASDNSELPLKIYIPDSSNKLLDSYVSNSIEKGIITNENKKYVNAFIVVKSDSIPIEMRLKGDWTDHLTSGKISYRIKIKGNNSFFGLKTFSIQHPKTRKFMHEWFMHKLCEKEDLLSTKFEMMPIEINGIYKGIYALEEHFDKQLLESRERREGPILKMDETGVWDVTLFNKKHRLTNQYPYFEASFISVFKKNKTLKNKILKKQFQEGSKLLQMFKSNFEDVNKIFDIKKTAKYYALLEIGNVHHAHEWHNKRFYFNPITERLESIGYDMLPDDENSDELFILNKLRSGKSSQQFQLMRMLLYNEDFKYYYLKYLQMFSGHEYLNNVFKELDQEIVKVESNIRIEEEGYVFDKEFYINRSEKIRKDLSFIDSIWTVFLESDPKKHNIIIEPVYESHSSKVFIESVSLNTYRHKIDSRNYQLEFENYHFNEIRVLGYRTKENILYTFEEPILLPAFKNNSQLIKRDIIINKKAKEIIFGISNHSGKFFSKKILKWEKPKGITARMELEELFQINSPFYKINGTALTFRRGDYKVDKILYIPPKYRVIISKGTSIDFVNGGGIIVNNSFAAKGTFNNPIHFYSSDGNNHGVTILQGDSVQMSYVKFDNLNTLHYKKWHLTGAVSIYESETKINNCSITNNLCEDGLNIIRSNFMIDSLFVSETKSDGFDADFCTGEIKNSRFENTGNDCIDFSGSVISVNNIVIINSGDKGISGGERSELIIRNINIDGAITGIAAKDDTKIIGDKITVMNAEFGLAAFQKKSEYSKASIRLTNVNYSNLQQYGLVDLGSFVVIDWKYYYGGMVIDIDKLYARYKP